MYAPSTVVLASEAIKQQHEISSCLKRAQARRAHTPSSEQYCWLKLLERQHVRMIAGVCSSCGTSWPSYSEMCVTCLQVCRHHAAAVAEGQGCTQSFVCPYHGWTYGRQLIHTWIWQFLAYAIVPAPHSRFFGACCCFATNPWSIMLNRGL